MTDPWVHSPREAVRCLVPGCENRQSGGRFVGELCAPCHGWLSRRAETCRTSQAARNEEAVRACVEALEVTRVLLRMRSLTVGAAIIDRVLAQARAAGLPGTTDAAERRREE